MSDATSPDAPIAYNLTDAARQAIAAHRVRVAERYVVTTGDGWTELWCQAHTSNGSDYLGEWEGSAEQHAAAILAARLRHEKEEH